MENMEKAMGFDEALEETTEKSETKKASPRRRPFAIWTVDGEDYKLRLTGAAIAKLEGQYKRNLLSVLTDDMPPLAVMLTVIQAAMQQYHHGMKFSKVTELYDNYVNEGGDQTTLYIDIVMDLLEVSGFFTTNQAETLKAEMEVLD
jgi:hypothetical protein